MLMHQSPGETVIHRNPEELLQNLIRFDTTNPPGNEAECVGYISRLLVATGLQTVLLGRQPNRPNLIARLPGAGRRSASVVIWSCRRGDYHQPEMDVSSVRGETGRRLYLG